MADGPTFDDRWSALQDKPPSTGVTINPDQTAPSPDGGPPVPQRLDTGKEIATLEVRGGLFTNWTSVRVEQRVTQPFPTFQFECSEESPIPLVWDAVQFVPGDIVRVYIGGVPAVFGYITERHVGFDEKNHGVRLIGCGDTVDLTNSSVPIEKLDGHDGQSWSNLATDLMAHLGIKLTTMGAVDNTPFEKIQIQPGETIMMALERYAKPRNIVIGSNANGGLLAIGENPVISTGDLVEGVNILRASVVLRDQMVYKKIYAMGQTNGSNAAYGDSQNKQIAFQPGTSSRNRYMVTVMDVADTMHGVQRRAMMEKVFTEGSFIEAQITVQGWFKDQNQSDDVWKAGEYYSITSPSLIMNELVLGCAGCVYEQSDAGTTTTLQLVDPIHMNGQLSYLNAAMNVMAAESARVAMEKQKALAAAAAKAQAEASQ